MTYRPGKHIIASLITENIDFIRFYTPFLDFIRKLISQKELKNLGEVCHNFPNGGFTAVICLSESHISIHTWPEHGLINVDIYLSNFERINDGTVELLYRSITDFFSATPKMEETLIR